jgi:hypothetical protein
MLAAGTRPQFTTHVFEGKCAGPWRRSRSIDAHHHLNAVAACIEAAQGLFKRRATSLGDDDR